MKLLREFPIVAERSGTDATGISYVRNGKIVTFKKAVPAHKFKLYFPKGAITVIGHNRMTKWGTELKKYSNHPFEGRTDRHTFALDCLACSSCWSCCQMSALRQFSPVVGAYRLIHHHKHYRRAIHGYADILIRLCDRHLYAFSGLQLSYQVTSRDVG